MTFSEFCTWIGGQLNEARDKSVGDYFRDKIKSIDGKDLSLVERATIGLGLIIPGISGLAAEATAALEGLNEPHTVGNIATASAVASAIGKLFGGDLSYLTTPFSYMQRSLNQLNVVEQTSCDMLYLFDLIDDNEWSCITRAHGNKVEMHRAVRDASAQRTNIPDTVQLWYRGWYKDEQSFHSDMRKRGVIDDAEINKWVKLAQQIPGMADLSTFMVRDAEDETVDWRSSDASFAQKYKGNIAAWAKQQGIPDEFFKYYWRAHWRLPSNTELYEMMARLRPGRTDETLTVTGKDAQKLLQQNDVEPNWVDKILAVSHSVINETALKMGFKNGVLSPEQLYEGFLDLKHTEKDAKLLVEMAVADANRQRANESNLWSRAVVLKSYRAGEIDRTRAAELLRRFTVTDELVDDALDDADELVQVGIRKQCISAVKNQILRGAITEKEGVNELIAIGVPDARAAELVKGFICYRESRGSEISLRYLSKIWKQGLITPQELYTRLLNLRYEDADAQLLLRSWSIELAADQAKEALRIQRQRVSEGYSARARYRTEVAWLQKQTDRKRKLAKDGLPDDTVDTAGVFVPPPPPPPPPK